RPANCDRRRRARRCPWRPPARTVPRRSSRPAGTRNATSPAIRYNARSCEDPVQEPALRAAVLMLAVTGAKQPVALTGLVLDPEIISDRGHLGIALPPFAANALRPVGAPYAPAHAAPGEPDGWMIGQ